MNNFRFIMGTIAFFMMWISAVTFVLCLILHPIYAFFPLIMFLINNYLTFKLWE